MKLEKLSIAGVWLGTSEIWSDDRGNFREWFKLSEVRENSNVNFGVHQSNISFSKKGVIRGIHYSLAKEGQSKWVTCVKGRILDVVVDIRPDSPTFKEHLIVELNEENGRSLLIENGLGHAFLSLQDNTAVCYLLNSPYSPSDEHAINPLDPELNIRWNSLFVDLDQFILSNKDTNAPFLLEQLNIGKLPLISKD